jgi:hypothetical protein
VVGVVIGVVVAVVVVVGSTFVSVHTRCVCHQKLFDFVEENGYGFVTADDRLIYRVGNHREMYRRNIPQGVLRGIPFRCRVKCVKM